MREHPKQVVAGLILIAVLCIGLVVLQSTKEASPGVDRITESSMSGRKRSEKKRDRMLVLVTTIAEEMFPEGKFKGNEQLNLKTCFSGITEFDVLNLVTRIEHETGHDLNQDILTITNQERELSQSLTISELADRFLSVAE